MSVFRREQDGKVRLTALTWHSSGLQPYDAVKEAPLDNFRCVSHHLRTQLCSKGNNEVCSRSETLVIMRNDGPVSVSYGRISSDLDEDRDPFHATPDFPQRIMCMMIFAAATSSCAGPDSRSLEFYHRCKRGAEVDVW